MASRPKDELGVTPPPRIASSSGIDVDKLQASLDKVASAVNRSAAHTKRIPGIEHKVEKTGIDIVRLETKMDGVTERVSKVESKVDSPHQCHNVKVISRLQTDQREASQKIDVDTKKGVKQSGEIATLKKDHEEVVADVEDIRKAPRRMFYGLIAIVVTIATTAGGALWFLAELNKEVEHEREQRVDQFKRIESQIKAIGNKSDNAPVTIALKSLAEGVEDSDAYFRAYEHLCDDMQPYEKRHIRSTLERRRKRVPESCF